MTRHSRFRTRALFAAGGLAIAACAGDSVSPGGDAGSDATADVTAKDSPIVDVVVGDGPVDSAADSPVDAGPPCNLAAPFGTPVNVAELNTSGDDYSGRLTADALTFYGLAGAAFAHHVTVATRASTSSPFGAPKAINLTIDADIITPFVTPDGGSLYFSSNVTGNGNVGLFDIFATTPPTATTFTDVPKINSSAYDYDPWVLSDGSAIFFASNRNSGFDDIWTAPIVAGNFGTPTLVANVNSTNLDNAPALTADGLTMYFASTRADSTHDHIYVTTRPNLTTPFAAPTLVSELTPSATSYDDVSWVSPDGCEMYLNSTYAYAGAKGGNDIYRARKP